MCKRLVVSHPLLDWWQSRYVGGSCSTATVLLDKGPHLPPQPWWRGYGGQEFTVPHFSAPTSQWEVGACLAVYRIVSNRGYWKYKRKHFNLDAKDGYSRHIQEKKKIEKRILRWLFFSFRTQHSSQPGLAVFISFLHPKSHLLTRLPPYWYNRDSEMQTTSVSWPQ